MSESTMQKTLINSPTPVAERRLLLGALVTTMIGSAVAAEYLKPKHLLADTRDSQPLSKLIPSEFDGWRTIDAGAIIQPDPTVLEALNKFYSDVLTRTYTKASGNQSVMLSIAYGKEQSDSMRVHSPEICYPAQGFEISSAKDVDLRILNHSISARQLLTKKQSRIEPVTYWITVGDTVVSHGNSRKFEQLKYGFKGFIPDGLLFRVSSIANDSEKAYSIHADFCNALFAAIPERNRNRFLGRLI